MEKALATAHLLPVIDRSVAVEGDFAGNGVPGPVYFAEAGNGEDKA